ncbi:MAG: phosphate ABC transporter permease subunit PstC [Peptococcaceae bacterium]|nr:phosphate ABC transporter permease subunit PstC [Peptococcaceae bacterium]
MRKFIDGLGMGLSLGCAGLVVALTASIIYFIGSKGLATFFVNDVRVIDFLFGARWMPEPSPGQGDPLVGTLPLTTGSVVISLLAVCLSAPLSIIAAVFMAEIAPLWGRRFIQPAIELLAGIPSVVYGYIGLSVLVPFIRGAFGGQGQGFSVLAGFLVLSVMIMPTIISVSTESLRALPEQWKHAAYALGSTRWQTIRMVILPAARSGIITGIVLGLARAFGEALAVQMVIGNVRQIPSSLLDPAITLTSAITMDMGYTVMGSLWNNALWSMALILLMISFFFILAIRLVSRRGAVR